MRLPLTLGEAGREGGYDYHTGPLKRGDLRAKK